MLLEPCQKPLGGKRVKRYSINRLFDLNSNHPGVGKKSGCDLYESIIGPSHCIMTQQRKGPSRSMRHPNNPPLSPKKSPLPLHSSVLFGRDFWLPNPLLKTASPVIFPYKLGNHERNQIAERKASMIDSGGKDYLGVFVHGMARASIAKRKEREERENPETGNKRKRRKRNENPPVTPQKPLSYFESLELDFDAFCASQAATKLRTRFRTVGALPIAELDEVIPLCIMKLLTKPNTTLLKKHHPKTPKQSLVKEVRPHRRNKGAHREDRSSLSPLFIKSTSNQSSSRKARYAKLPIDSMQIKQE